MSIGGKKVMFSSLFSASNDVVLVVSINIPVFGFNFITCFAFRLVSESDDGKIMPLANNNYVSIIIVDASVSRVRSFSQRFRL